MTYATYSLPVVDTVKAAWAKVSGAKATFWAVLAIMFVVQFGMGLISGLLQAPDGSVPLFMMIPAVIVGVLMLLLAWGLLYIGIQRAAGMPIQFRMAGYAFNVGLFFRIIGLYILQMLIMAAVSLLLSLSFVILHSSDSTLAAILALVVYVIWLVAFIYIVFRMYLGKGFVLARQMGPLDAIKESFEATKGNVLSLLGVTCLNLLILFVSAIPFGIGLIWSLPYVFINYGEVFKRLVTTRLT